MLFSVCYSDEHVMTLRMSVFVFLTKAFLIEASFVLCVISFRVKLRFVLFSVVGIVDRRQVRV